jgi:hypothetical protein
MNSREKWKHASAPAKWISVLAVLLIMQIGGCVATPALTGWIDTQFHIAGGEGWGNFGLVLWELLFCALTSLLMLICLIWWIVRTVGGKRESAHPGDRAGNA